MSVSPTLGDLYKTNDLTEGALSAFVAGFVARPSPGIHEVAPGITLDVAQAIADSPYASGIMGREEATEPQKRAAVRTAMLLARVELASDKGRFDEVRQLCFAQWRQSAHSDGGSSDKTPWEGPLRRARRWIA